MYRASSRALFGVFAATLFLVLATATSAAFSFTGFASADSLPNLVASTPIVSPSSPIAGSPLTVQFLIFNLGTVSVPLDYDIDDGGAAASNAAVGTSSIPDCTQVDFLGPRSSCRVQQQLTYSSAGTKRITVTIDKSNLVAESKETDNVRVKEFTVRASDAEQTPPASTVCGPSKLGSTCEFGVAATSGYSCLRGSGTTTFYCCPSGQQFRDGSCKVPTPTCVPLGASGDGACCSGTKVNGVCTATPACVAVGASGDAACCTGSKVNGVCTLPCVALGSSGDGACCSGNKVNGVCTQPCVAIGSPVTDSQSCCGAAKKIAGVCSAPPVGLVECNAANVNVACTATTRNSISYVCAAGVSTTTAYCCPVGQQFRDGICRVPTCVPIGASGDGACCTGSKVNGVCSLPCVALGSSGDGACCTGTKVNGVCTTPDSGPALCNYATVGNVCSATTANSNEYSCAAGAGTTTRYCCRNAQQYANGACAAVNTGLSQCNAASAGSACATTTSSASGYACVSASGTSTQYCCATGQQYSNGVCMTPSCIALGSPVTGSQTCCGTAVVVNGCCANPSAIPGQFQARSVISGGATYNYQVFIPSGYNPANAYPVIVFVHGSGERGNNNVQQISVGLGPYISANSASFPAIAVFPQIPLNQYAEGDPRNMNAAGMNALVLATLQNTRNEFNVDSHRMYLTGFSMGAFRTWSIAYQNPTLFAALVPIAGGPVPAEEGVSTIPQAATALANQLHTVSIWMWHGDADGTVPIATYAYPIRDAFAVYGPPSTFKFTVGAGHGHEVEYAYADPTLWTWLWAQHN